MNILLTNIVGKLMIVGLMVAISMDSKISQKALALLPKKIRKRGRA